MQSINKRVGYLRVESALHILLQLLWLQHLVATRSLFKYIMYLAQQHWLFFRVRQSVDSKVRLQFTLAVGVRLNGYRAKVYQLQYACRQQVIVVGSAPLVCVQHVVGLLQITVQRYVAIPHQVFVHTPSGTPLIHCKPYATHHGRYKYHQYVQHSKQSHRVVPVHLLIIAAAGIVAAIKGHLFLLLKCSLVFEAWIKQPFGELRHYVQRSLTAHGLGCLGHYHAILIP